MSEQTMIVWLRQDFRLQDNAALAAAAAAGYRLLPVYLHCPIEEGGWQVEGAAAVWLHHALLEMEKTLSGVGLPLVIRQGKSALSLLQDLLRESAAAGVYWNRRYEPAVRARDAAVKRELREAGWTVESHNSHLLFEPHEAATGSGKPYQVYTPFWKCISAKTVRAPVAVDVKELRPAQKLPKSLQVADLGLCPEKAWPAELMSHWRVGEQAAQEVLREFVDGAAAGYHKGRDFPAQAGTSRLSPYLRWGHIGPRQVWQALVSAGLQSGKGGQVYLQEIGWREFAYHVLFHFPETPLQPLREKYANFPWQPDQRLLRAWQRGQTGYPLVDAGMRQLYREGWMHNRVRMVVASFLVKHLLQDWTGGARWFWDTLVDADLASNTLGWQWSAGCGADAAPYFRVFNPITQAAKFDPEGHYIRRYVPELSKLQTPDLFAPWEAGEISLREAGVVLGETYPRPLVDQREGRQRALDALKRLG